MMAIAPQLHAIRRPAPMALVFVLIAWACGSDACRGDDDIVIGGGEVPPSTSMPGGGIVVVGRQPPPRQPQYDLGGLFDQQVFGRLAGRNQVFIVDGKDAARKASSAEQALAAVRERCEHRIKIVESICGLDASQIRTLAMAVESDLKRIGSQIEFERERYVGRTMPATPQGLDRAVLEEVRDRATKCRRLLDSITGPASLFAGIVKDILSAEQAVAFEAWVDGRRACRWKAMVKSVLVQLDESGLGLSEAQASSLEKILMARSPRLDVLRDGTIGSLDGRMAQFQLILVTSQLARQRDQWEQLLDPRQQASLTERIESYGDPTHAEAMLVDLGVLEQNVAPTGDKETK